MIVSSNPIPRTLRWVFGLVLLCAVGLLPLGVAYAQDFDAVGRRLRSAIEAGELTPEQARAMMAALKNEAGANIRAVGIRLRKAVGAGELTAKQAHAMLATLEKSSGARKDRGSERAKVYLVRVKKELAAAVRAGKITKEQAAKRYEGAEKAIKKRMAAGRRGKGRAGAEEHPDPGRARAREYLMKVKKELGAAVEAGRITREQAAERYKGAEKGVKERMATGRRQSGARRISREEFRRAAAEIRKGVAAGRIPEEAARIRLGEMRRAMAEQGGRKRPRDPRAAYRAIERRIKAAVEAGKISEEDAKRKLVEARKRLGERERGGKDRGAGRERDPRAAYRAIERRIKAAVEAGKISEEDAERKLVEARKRMFGRRRSL